MERVKLDPVVGRRDYQKMMNLAETIKGEINRMCVTDDLTELKSMAMYVKKNIDILLEIKKPYVWGGSDD